VEVGGTVDGAKGVDAVVTAYLSRIMRRIPLSKAGTSLQLVAEQQGVRGYLNSSGSHVHANCTPLGNGFLLSC
jgi:hypothetical protein